MPLSDSFTPKEAEEIIQAAMKNKRLKRADAEALLNRDLASKRNPLLARQWVNNFAITCKEICANNNLGPYGLFAEIFWIRLYGVITDLRRRHESTASLHDSIVSLGKRDDYIAAGAAVFEHCSAIKDQFTRDELIYATFRRHVHSHVYQDSFDFGVEEGNESTNQPAALRKNQKIRPLQEHVDVDYAHEVLDRIEREFGHDALRVTQHFANKIAPQVIALFKAMKVQAELAEVERQRSDAVRPALTEMWEEATAKEE